MPSKPAANKKRPSANRVSSKLPARCGSYLCRICKKPHGLKKCKRFLKMSMKERIEAVRKHNYCSNCLAHTHSHGTCFTKHGCKHCKKFHHTLLHVNPRLLSNFDLASVSSRSSSPEPTTSVRSDQLQSVNSSNPVSLSAVIRQNTIFLLPTVLAKIGKKTSYARCLLDSGSTISRISKQLVDKLNLTCYSFKEETICQTTLKSRFNAESKIEATLRVDERIAMRTPSQSLPKSIKNHFRDLFLGDPNFYECSGLDIIIGVDLYTKVIEEGVFARVGLPTAQRTIFGWAIFGPCTL
ncbi:hypothetical protein EVAR_100642_1 [Eumeta japonica]|uniref:Uncharacterized protein n=1 Tax=Eumeta variegata TaxID=151549 RepID=A0A4C1T2N5_EUMVA|nr:hypothetical protein EVAR_100642_1 [Eumeta japonica]